MKGNFLEEKFMPIAVRIGNQRHLIAIRDGIMFSMALMIIGSLFATLPDLPIPAYQDFMTNTFGEDWSAPLWHTVSATFGIVALVSVFGIAFSLASSYEVDGKKIDGVPAGVLSLASFFIVSKLDAFTVGEESVEAWDSAIFASKNLFLALIIAIIVGEIYRVFLQKKIVITMPKSVPPTVSRSFTSLIPGTFIILLFFSLKLIFAATQWETFSHFIYEIVSKPMTAFGTSYIGTLGACLFEHALWSVGIHGSSIMTSVMEPGWIAASEANLEAVKAGTAIPHIINYAFYENGVWIGGSGATLPAVVYMLFAAKSKLLKQIGKLAIAPAIFNINEPIVFGLPVILNPFLMIPFILAPIAVFTVTYLGTAIGIFPHTTGIMPPWTTPYFISGYIMTGLKIGGVIMQIVGFAVAFFIWLPFIRIWDKKNVDMEKLDAAK